jgi:hypothetical protein
MDRPPADPAKLLATWMDWEAGVLTPGRVMADLKTGGLRDVLEHLAAQAAGADGDTTIDGLGVDAG